MHELSIAEALLGVCERELAGRGARSLAFVRVAVGELAAVEPDLLRFAWDALVHGTAHDGAVLEVEFRVAAQVCDGCGPIDERQPGTWLRLCPRCGSPLRVRGGDELDLLTFTAVDAALPNTAAISRESES